MDIEAYIASGILEAYVLGQATAEETAILECVAKKNPRVQEALAEASLTLENLAQAEAHQAPDLKAAIWNRLQQETGKGSVAKTATLPFPEKKAGGQVVVWKTFAVAASLLLVVSTIGYFKSREHNREVTELLSQSQQQVSGLQSRLTDLEGTKALMAQPGMQLVMLDGVKDHPEAKALVFWNQRDKKVYLDALNLPQTPSGKQYQLWAIVDGKPVSAGMYASNTAQPLATMQNAQAFAITLEKEGGVAAPTMEAMVVMGTVKG